MNEYFSNIAIQSIQHALMGALDGFAFFLLPVSATLNGNEILAFEMGGAS